MKELVSAETKSATLRNFAARARDTLYVGSASLIGGGDGASRCYY